MLLLATYCVRAFTLSSADLYGRAECFVAYASRVVSQLSKTDLKSQYIFLLEWEYKGRGPCYFSVVFLAPSSLSLSAETG